MKNFEMLHQWVEQSIPKVAFLAAPPAGPTPGGAPPMPPEMMGGAPPMPPADPSQTMNEQEMMRSVFQEELQKALGGCDAGQGIAAPKKGNKSEDIVAAMEQRIMKAMEQQNKIYLAALRQAGIEIPMADVMGIENSTHQHPRPGLTETLNPSNSGTNEGSLVAKVAEIDFDIADIVKLANARAALKRSAMGVKLVPFDPMLPEKNYFSGLYR